MWREIIAKWQESWHETVWPIPDHEAQKERL